MEHKLVIDGNSLAHASHNATKLTCGPMQVQAIFGVLKSIRHLLEQTPGAVSPLVLWDGKAHWRKALLPDYKGNRVAKNPKEQAHKDALSEQKPYLEKMLQYLGVPQMKSPLLEADDLAGHLVPRLAKATRVTLVTGDQDWLQLVDENVSWFDPIRNRRVNLENFYEFTGYKTTRAFVQGKCLHGDTSDNVPGVGGIGEKGAPLFLAQYGDVYSFFEAVDKKHAMKLSKAVNALASPDGRALFARNMKLMDLRQARKPEPGEVIFTKFTPDVAKFELMCRRFMFNSILREMDVFLAQYGISRPPPLEAAA